MATDELINIAVGGEHGFKPTAMGAELVCCTGAQVPSPIFTMLNIAVYNPLLAKVMLPVLVPVPALGVTPAEGTITHCTEVLGVPPDMLKDAVAPTAIAAEDGLTVAALALGLGQGLMGASTKKRTLAVAELGSTQPAGTVLLVVVNNTWYSPATLKVIRPVLVPVPVLGDTPLVGKITQVVVAPADAPVRVKVAVLPVLILAAEAVAIPGSTGVQGVQELTVAVTRLDAALKQPPADLAYK